MKWDFQGNYTLNQTGIKIIIKMQIEFIYQLVELVCLYLSI